MIISNYLLAIAGRKGPIGLYKNETFLDLANVVDSIDETLASGSNYSQRIQKIQRECFTEFFSILTKQQKKKLASRLGFEPEHLNDIGTYMPIKGVVNHFSIPDFRVSRYGFEGVKDSLAKKFEKVEGLWQESNYHAEFEDVILEFEQALETCPLDGIGKKTFITKLDEAKNRYREKWQTTLTNRLLKAMDTQGNDTFLSWKGFENLSVRFHVEEVDFSGNEMPTRGMAGRSASMDGMINLLDVNQLRWTLKSDGAELTHEQWSQLDRANRTHQKNLANTGTIEEWIELNNEFLANLSEILLPVQYPTVFQQFFYQYGPYMFFKRPDVVTDFGLTRNQQNRMDELAKRIVDTIEIDAKKIKEEAMHKLFQLLPEEGQKSAENLLGIPLDELSKIIVDAVGDQGLKYWFSPRYDPTKYSPRKIWDDSFLVN